MSVTKLISRPVLLCDPDRCRENISFMTEKARAAGKLFRPHFKTHQSRTIGDWFRGAGVDRIAVSSVEMAAYFAGDRWKDISIAFPVNLRELDRIRDLNDRIQLQILVSQPESLEIIHKKMNRPVRIFVELDTGDRRSGFDANNAEILSELIKEMKRYPKLRFQGFLVHNGRSYQAGNREQANLLHQESMKCIRKLRTLFPSAQFSMGDTPSCSLSDDFEGVDEIRPGNFVFYDLSQEALGACRDEQIAISLVCPVVARYPERRELVVYGGKIHLSCESMEGPGQTPVYGMICGEESGFFGPGISGAYVRSLSQEHGVISMPPEHMQHFPPGSLVGILPVHSCLTADCMKGYLSTSGKLLDHMRGGQITST